LAIAVLYLRKNESNALNNLKVNGRIGRNFSKLIVRSSQKKVIWLTLLQSSGTKNPYTSVFKNESIEYREMNTKTLNSLELLTYRW